MNGYSNTLNINKQNTIANLIVILIANTIPEKNKPNIMSNILTSFIDYFNISLLINIKNILIRYSILREE
jgi:hypothetical protein